MKIECECGQVIVDQTDELPHKAYLVPDQDWFGFLAAVDAVIDEVHVGKLGLPEAYMAVRRAWPSRLMWQCRTCGRLYIDDQKHTLNVFLPAETQGSREILRGRD